MCGIVGVIAKQKMGLNNFDTKIFEQMLIVDQVRGTDGTGMFFNNKRNAKSISVLKGACDSTKFTSDKQFDTSMGIVYKEANFVIGHNRASTKGSSIVKNTHPFRERHITLIHNGTLNTHKELNKEVEVDSHAICHSIAEIGHIETLKKIDGAFALVWFNAQDGNLYMCRNYQRPLSIIETSTSYIIASEPKMAEWIIDRNNTKVVKVINVKPYELHKFHISDMSTYTTETVEYKPWVQQKKWNNYTPPKKEYTQPPSEIGRWRGATFNIGKKSTFKENYFKDDIVMFRPTSIVTNSNTDNYVVGDIYCNPIWVDYKDRIPVFDYENKRRLRIYGNYQEIMKIYNSKDMVAKITGTMQMGNAVVYLSTISNVWKEIDSNITQLPAPIPVLSQQECPFCTKSFDIGTGIEMHGFTVCQECAEDISGATTAIMQ